MAGNANVARRGFVAFSRGDFEASLAEIHPEVEWHVAFRLPDLPLDKEVYRGHDEVRELWDAFTEMWETVTLEIEEVLEDRDEILVLKSLFVARGSRAGIEVERVLYYAMELRDGRLVRVRPFDSPAEARQALGLDD